MSGSRRKPGPLKLFVEGYREWLLGRGYSPSVVIRSRITLGHLGRWMECEALAVDALTAEGVSDWIRSTDPREREMRRLPSPEPARVGRNLRAFGLRTDPGGTVMLAGISTSFESRNHTPEIVVSPVSPCQKGL